MSVRRNEAEYRKALRARKRANQPLVCCNDCGHAFRPTRSSHCYCSPACKQKAYRRQLVTLSSNGTDVVTLSSNAGLETTNAH